MAAALLAAGCTTAAEPPQRTPATAHDAAEQGPQFAVEYEVADAAAGKASLAKVRVEPRGAFHMNLDFPVALDVAAPADVDVVAGQQRKGDAERFDDDALVFAVPFTAATKGKKHFGGSVEFAVCGEQSCAPQKVPVDFTVEVGCDTDALC